MADETPDVADVETESADAEVTETSAEPAAEGQGVEEASASKEPEAPYEPRVLGDDFARCLAPIEGDDPCGENPRYDEDSIDLFSDTCRPGDHLF